MEKIMLGQITVKRKPNKSKARIRDHGSVFNVIQCRLTQCSGDALNIESLEKTDRVKNHKR